QGDNLLNVRGIGLIGGGVDASRSIDVLRSENPQQAAQLLRDDEAARLARMRQIAITSVNNLPVRVEDVIEGGPLESPGATGEVGLEGGHQPRLGRVSLSQPRRDAQGNEVKDKDGNTVWDDEEEKIQGIVLLRKGEDCLPAIDGVETKIQTLNNQAGRLLPGV